MLDHFATPLANTSGNLYAAKSFEHTFDAGSGTDAADTTPGLAETAAAPVIPTRDVPAARNFAASIGATMLASNSLHPFRVHPDDRRESLAIHAHFVVAEAMPKIHRAGPDLHREIIDRTVQEQVQEAPDDLSIDDARIEIAEMVERYIDLFMPSADAAFCSVDGLDDGIAWQHPNVGIFFDMVVAGSLGAESQILDPELAEAVRGLLDQGVYWYATGFAGIRIVSLDQPHRSLKVTPSGDGIFRLAATNLDPWHIELGQVSA